MEKEYTIPPVITEIYPALGQVNVPVNKTKLVLEFNEYVTVKDGKSVVVSKGLGTHTIKIRFLNPAEVVVLHLKGK